jgi:hypothetical protein
MSIVSDTAWWDDDETEYKQSVFHIFLDKKKCLPRIFLSRFPDEIGDNMGDKSSEKCYKTIDCTDILIHAYDSREDQIESEDEKDTSCETEEVSNDTREHKNFC